ncbi:MAG: hypothetical protein KGK08_02695 [Acidobacteriota bacterium]|nr:hypothetical protein [Acidobacteriota bacterium]
MASSRKKVLVRRFRPGGSTDVLAGYLPAGGFVRSRALDLLDLEGRTALIPLNDVKYVAYVKEFNLADTQSPERLTRRTFLARPRTEGLWLRLSFTTGETLEGLAPTDLALADDLVNHAGLFLTPPDIRSNTQRLYIPRTSIAELTLIAVITSPSRRKPPVASSGSDDLQQALFDAELPPNARPN